MTPKHTPLPWKMVSKPSYHNGLTYTSVQPVTPDEEATKQLAMMNGEFHVCRMNHTAAGWRISYHRANAEFIVRACNSHYDLLDAAKLALRVAESWIHDQLDGTSAFDPAWEELAPVRSVIAKAEGGAA